MAKLKKCSKDYVQKYRLVNTGLEKLVFISIKSGEVVSYSSGILEMRYMAELNSIDFGKLIGVSGRTVEGWEYGKYGKVPSRQSLLLIQKAFC